MFLHFGYHRLPSLRMRIPDRDDGTWVAQIGEKLCTHVLGIITERLRDATLPCRFSNSHSILRVSLVNRGRPTKRASNNDGCPTVRLSTSRLRALETSPDLVSKDMGRFASSKCDCKEFSTFLPDVHRGPWYCMSPGPIWGNPPPWLHPRRLVTPSFARTMEKKTWFSPKSGTLNSHKNEACLISGQSTNFEVLTRMAQTQITLRQFKMTMVLCWG